MRGKPNPFLSSEYALLGLIYEKPTHGYDLYKVISDPENIGMIWRVKLSNLYAQLTKLEQKGFISGIEHPGEIHPSRTEYQITSAGKIAFETWVTTTVKHPRDFRQEFMVRYFFMQKFFPQKSNALCQNQLIECKTWLSNTLNLDQKTKEENAFTSSVIKFRIAQIQAIISWLEESCA